MRTQQVAETGVRRRGSAPQKLGVRGTQLPAADDRRAGAGVSRRRRRPPRTAGVYRACRGRHPARRSTTRQRPTESRRGSARWAGGTPELHRGPTGPGQRSRRSPRRPIAQSRFKRRRLLARRRESMLCAAGGRSTAWAQMEVWPFITLKRVDGIDGGRLHPLAGAPTDGAGQYRAASPASEEDREATPSSIDPWCIMLLRRRPAGPQVRPWP